jgi:endogenous inhibitor of DNA gyrase (YacG/DUF329 family)
MPRCPICSRPAAPRAENNAFPFCSARCKLIDHGKWLDERYRVPVSDPFDEGEETATPPEAPPEDLA